MLNENEFKIIIICTIIIIIILQLEYPQLNVHFM